MNIYKDRFYITNENSYLDSQPKIYFDCFITWADLKKLWYDESMLYLEVGIFGHFISFGLVLNKKRRKRNKKEEERYRKFHEAFVDKPIVTIDYDGYEGYKNE